MALRAIRDSGKPSRRIYRKTHATFEDYCKERWGFSRDFANKTIRAVETIEIIEMDTNSIHLPTTETQARELTRLSAPEQIVEVWNAATKDAESEGKRVTAAHIRTYIEEAKEVIEKPLI